MAQLLHKLPIKKKLLLIMTTSSALALLLITLALTSIFIFKIRKNVLSELKVASDMIGQNCTPSISSKDKAALSQILSSFKANTNIDNAILYDTAGKVLATYHSETLATGLIDLPSINNTGQQNTYEFSAHFVTWYQPLTLENESIGTLFLRYNLHQIRTELLYFTIILIATFCLCLGIALIVSRSLRHLIISPLIDLYQSIRKITTNKDYSIRLETHSNDEVSSLIDSFNGILTDIQNKDTQLEKYSSELENQVITRTAELVESNRQLIIFRKFAENAGQGLVIAKLNYEIVYINPSFKTLTETSAISDAINKQLSQYYQAENINKLKNEILPLVLQKGQWTGEINMQAAETKEIPTITNFFIIYDESQNPLYLAALITNITNSKNTELALKKAKEDAEDLNKQLALAIGEAQRQSFANKAKSEFLANMSHEIRTPMNAVMGMAALLMDTDLNPVQKDFVETIKQSSDALLGIINDILDLSKIESGMMEMSTKPLDIVAVIDEVIDLLTVQATQKNIDLAYFIQKDTPRYIIGDATRLRQILINLIGNAIKFTDEGSVCIKVSHLNSSNSVTLLEFAIQDSGIGIQNEKITQLFKPFSQIDSSSTRRFGGTGLGLNISKRLAEMMQGTMWVKSVYGQGSTFFFTISCKVNVDANPSIIDTNKLTNKNLLLIFPNRNTGNLLAQTLNKYKIHTVLTNSSKEAFEMLSSNQTFDAIIIPSKLPDADCINFAVKIQKIELFKSIPLIIAATISDITKIKNAASVLSNTHVISTPIKENPLLRTLNDSLANIKQIKTKETIFLNTNEQTISHQSERKILLVEDNKVNQKVALLLFSKMGYNPDVANNGLEALEAMKKIHYNTIYMDMQMPVMNGIEATREIRQFCEQNNLEQPLIIALTAGATTKERDACFESGMNDFITKPIKIEELKSSLELKTH